MPESFPDRLARACQERATGCIVGLDPDVSRMPRVFRDQVEEPEHLASYCRLVIDRVHDLVPMVKPQAAYFERFGSVGLTALETTVAYARSKGLLVLLDVKRGDIGSTSKAYAEAYLSPERTFDADAMTVSPYLGADSLEPFVEACDDWGKGLFVLVKTSNPGSGSLQDVATEDGAVCDHVARLVESISASRVGRCGLGPVGAVVAATHPGHAARLRGLMPHAVFLIPGLGAQGGDPNALGPYAASGGGGCLVSSSRAIMYPEGTFSDIDALGEGIRDAARKFIAQVPTLVAGS